ncbi:TetR/AcrR family transcriptional regulator [Luteimicrobium sp. NPDC057192]|uniref:TetR/AcrR family transcriptional regulator n=1 Tax=Luteimicrobium sp. NPDC057192 TaxID=3346042 RepID=UPI0036453E91
MATAAAAQTGERRTPRSARGATTRGAILDAAQELFVSPGYRATSLRDIAAAVGLSHQGVRRHFDSKDEILLAVVERFGSVDLDDPADVSEGLGIVAIAERNAERPGYLELFSALAGEAAVASHPAHERMRARYVELLNLSTDWLAWSQSEGMIGAGRDLRAEALRLAAAWDGLQLLQLYLPGPVQVVPALAQHETLLACPPGSGAAAGPPPDAPAPLPALDLEPEEDAVEGYAKGRERRGRIIADATRLFATEGYGDTSMRDVAERVGVSKSTLFHHFASKEDLLGAVLTARDAQISDAVTLAAAGSARELLETLADGARSNAADEPGLVEVYAVLSCEATASDHPAHAYFQRRYARTLDTFTAVFEAAQADGDLPPHRDPVHEAAWLVALWDGLQIQWMYDRTLDVGAHLAAHVADVLPPRA